MNLKSVDVVRKNDDEVAFQNPRGDNIPNLRNKWIKKSFETTPTSSSATNVNVFTFNQAFATHFYNSLVLSILFVDSWGMQTLGDWYW